MNQTFYHFAMKYREPSEKTKHSVLANRMYNDLDFPKRETDYQPLSEYIELTDQYTELVSAFDDLWEEYRLAVRKEF